MKNILIAIATTAALTFTLAAAEHSGKWTKKSQNISGSWKVEGRTLTLTGFATKSAPDLKLFLSPKPLGELKNKNATEGAQLVAKLKKTSGDQTYTIPADVDLSRFKTLILHCQKYSKLWGASDL